MTTRITQADLELAVMLYTETLVKIGVLTPERASNVHARQLSNKRYILEERVPNMASRTVPGLAEDTYPKTAQRLFDILFVCAGNLNLLFNGHQVHESTNGVS